MYISKVALAEWLRRVPAKYMGFPRESSNLSGDELFFGFLFFNIYWSLKDLHFAPGISSRQILCIVETLPSFPSYAGQPCNPRQEIVKWTLSTFDSHTTF